MELFKLIPENQERKGSHKTSEEKKLELRLGPPGEFLGYKSSAPNTTQGFKRVLEEDKIGAKTGEAGWFRETINEKHCKKFSSPWLSCTSSSFDEVGQDKQPYSTTHAGANVSQKRAAVAPVVGWPPIRSFRKNISNNSTSKLASKSPDKIQEERKSLKPESIRNDFFVKINVEGVPIGRKINLNAYDSYEKLSVAIDELFRGLIAAQKETPSLTENNPDETKENAGTVAGSGKYTLVYEDNEGDRMLVGDVPWNMFVSTVKRLRVLKSFEASNPRLQSNSRSEHENIPLTSVVETGR